MKARIYTNDFNRIIAATKSFTAESASRPVHQYIRLEFNAEESIVTAVAVDGFRLSVEHAVISDCDESFVAYVKGNVKLPGKQYATISIEEKEAMIRCAGCVFGYYQPQGDFLDYEKVIPTGGEPFRIGFNGNLLLSALQAAKVSCGDSFKNPVVLEFRGPVSPVLIRTNNSDVKMVLPVRIKEG